MFSPLIGALAGLILSAALLPSPDAYTNGGAFWSGVYALGILAIPTLASYYLSERIRWDSYRAADFWFGAMSFFVGACFTAGAMTLFSLISALVDDTL